MSRAPGLADRFPTAALMAGLLLAFEARADDTAIFDQDIQRFTQYLSSPVPERRAEGVRGLSDYKHWPAEPALIGLLDDAAPAVQREALLALCKLGTSQSMPHLMKFLSHRSWELRQNAWLALGRMTAQTYPADPQLWERWWQAGTPQEKEQALFAAVKQPGSRRAALRALRHLASNAAEISLLEWLAAGPQPPLDPDEHRFIAETLERIGTARSIPVLAGWHSDGAAWGLGRLGGPQAEKALLRFPKSLPVLLNLDRLQSTNAGPYIPFLVASMGLVTFRGQPDDLMNPEPQPIQRVAAQLIRRSGRAPLFIELVLQELEDTMKPPLPHAPRPAVPADWTQMLEAMREELKPGFVRNDGVTTSQPLTAVYHLGQDQALARRLVPLLRHPAFVPRIYVAMLLGKLHADEGLPAILDIIREGYPFSDATALASGKHFDQSQTVRWRGFLCMALGRMGGEPARRALEALAIDAGRPRDVRFGSVVGLGFIGSPQSLPVLRRVAREDIIWMVRDEARRAALEIETLARGGRS